MTASMQIHSLTFGAEISLATTDGGIQAQQNGDSRACLSGQ